MKKMFCVLLILTCLSCTVSKTKYSDIKEEQAEVTQVTYVPAVHTTSIGLGIGTTSGGGLTTTIVPMSSSSDEQWLVIFKCQDHGKAFALNCKELYEKLKQGDTVTLRYVNEIRYTVSGCHGTPENEHIVDQHTREVVVKDQVIRRK